MTYADTQNEKRKVRQLAGFIREWIADECITDEKLSKMLLDVFLYIVDTWTLLEAEKA